MTRSIKRYLKSKSVKKSLKRKSKTVKRYSLYSLNVNKTNEDKLVKIYNELHKMEKENKKPLFQNSRAQKLALEFEKLAGDDEKYEHALFKVHSLTKKKSDMELVYYYKSKNLPHLDWITTKNLALSFYKSDLGYVVINNHLRQIKIEQYIKNKGLKENDYIKEYIKTVNTLSKKVDKTINLIDKSMNKKQSGTQVFRGLQKVPGFSPFDSEKIYREMSYSSTSLNFCQSWRFMDRKSKCCVLSFKIPDNIKSFDFKDIGGGKDESGEEEILIQRDIIYHIGESITIGGVKFYSCVITPDKDVKDVEVKLGLEKQLDYLRIFKNDYQKIRGKTPEEIMKYFDKNKPSYSNTIHTFDYSYAELCLDTDLKDKVKSLKYPSSESFLSSFFKYFFFWQ